MQQEIKPPECIIISRYFVKTISMVKLGYGILPFFAYTQFQQRGVHSERERARNEMLLTDLFSQRYISFKNKDENQPFWT